MVKLYDLTVERVKEPLAVKRSGVRFGWKLDSDEKDVVFIYDENGNHLNQMQITDEEVIELKQKIESKYK